jgi:hypothetical protein
MRVQRNSFTHLRDLLVLTDHFHFVRLPHTSWMALPSLSTVHEQINENVLNHLQWANPNCIGLFRLRSRNLLAARTLLGMRVMFYVHRCCAYTGGARTTFCVNIMRTQVLCVHRWRGYGVVCTTWSVHRWRMYNVMRIQVLYVHRWRIYNLMRTQVLCVQCYVYTSVMGTMLCVHKCYGYYVVRTHVACVY